ncbi:MAG TPA: MFS transporter [Steroidobacteraceae bacterium]|jgi:MFS family permease|nr:MFS transporter [Steroidobacteraceae bacterium]
MASPVSQAWWRGLTREQWFVLVGASLAWLFDCFDQQVFNLARDGAMDTLLPSAAHAAEYGSYTTSVFLIGWAGGGLIFGALGDRYGRAKVLTLCILLYSLSTGFGAFSTGIFDFCAYRFMSGLGVGGVFGLAVALVADSLPDRARAPSLGILQSISTWGNLAAGGIGMFLGVLAARHLLPLGLRHWQVMFLVGALPAFLCVFVLRHVGEPPNWVAAQAESAKRGVTFGSYRHLFGHPQWSRHAWLGLVGCSAGIIGLWGIGNFHPFIVGSLVDQRFAGAGLTHDALAAQKAYWRSVGLLLQAGGGFLGMLSLAIIAQRVGRRFAFALALLLSFLSTLLVFKYLRELPQIYWMLPIMGFGQLSVFAVYAVYLPELFPMSLRSTGPSFCYNVGRLVAASAPFTIGQVTRRLGGNVEGFRTAGMWVSLLLLAGIVVLPYLPETKGRPLPVD